MDEGPSRRSLRAAGMTPLRPMSSIMFGDQAGGGGGGIEQTTRRGAKSPTRLRGSSRSGTPKRAAAAIANARIANSGSVRTMQSGGSRLDQTFNLASDISSSDFLGDTPTARFHGRQNAISNAGGRSRIEDTVTARKSTNTAIGQTTVKAQRVNRQPLNVFLKQTGIVNDGNNERRGRNGGEGGGGFNLFYWFGSIVIFISFLKDSIYYFFIFARSIIKSLFFKPIEALTPKKATVVASGRAFLRIAFVAAFIFSAYAIAQLDWKLAQRIGSALFNNNKQPVRSTGGWPLSSTSSSTPIIPKTKPVRDLNLEKDSKANILMLRNRITEVEAAMNEAKAHINGTGELIRGSVQSFQDQMITGNERIAMLEVKISQLEMDTSQLGSSLSAFGQLSQTLERLKTDFTRSKELIEHLKRELSTIRELQDEKMFRNLVRSQMADILPQQLLVRKNPDGTIYLDSGFLKLLYNMFATRGEEKDIAMGAARTAKRTGNSISETEKPFITGEASMKGVVTEKDSNSSASPSNASLTNLYAIENLINGRLSQVEHKIVDKDEVIELITKKLGLELGELKRFSAIERNSIEKRISVVEQTIPNDLTIKQKVSDLIKKRLENYNFEPVPDGIGLADYALESMDARVVTSKTSPVFTSSDGFLSFLINPNGRGKAAKTALNADNSLGNCWSFEGSKGMLTIALGTEITPSHFSIDHVKLDVDRSSAPRHFQVHAFSNLSSDLDGSLLGEYEYKLDGPAVQTFVAQFILTNPVRFLRLTVLSNWGKYEYTCLYRWRVHSHSHPHSTTTTDNSRTRKMYHNGDSQ